MEEQAQQQQPSTSSSTQVIELIPFVDQPESLKLKPSCTETEITEILLLVRGGPVTVTLIQRNDGATFPGTSAQQQSANDNDGLKEEVWLPVISRVNPKLTHNIMDLTLAKELHLDEEIQPWNCWNWKEDGLITAQVRHANITLVPVGILERLSIKLPPTKDKEDRVEEENVIIVRDVVVVNLKEPSLMPDIPIGVVTPWNWLEFGSSAPPEVFKWFKYSKDNQDQDPEKTKTDNIMQLPDEVWLHILSFLSPTEDKDTIKYVRAVNSRLHHLVNSTRRIVEQTPCHVTATSFDVFRKLSETPLAQWGTTASLTVKVNDAKANNTTTIEGVIPEPLPEKLNSCLNTLKLINCAGNAPSFYLSDIIDKCTQLKCLTIGKCENAVRPSDGPLPPERKWPSIESLTLINDSTLTPEVADAILKRLVTCKELAVIGSRWLTPTTKRERNNLTDEYKQYWEQRVNLLTTVVLGHIWIHASTLRSLDVSFHPLLADSTFLQDLIDHHPQPHLESLRLELCDIPIKLMSKVLRSTGRPHTFAGSLEAHKCQHVGKYKKNYLTHRFNQYHNLLAESPVISIQNLSLTHCKGFNCLCFLKKMVHLEELDISYNYDIHCKELHGFTRLKKFVCVANRQLRLDIRKMHFGNLKWLDLSYSNLVRCQKDFEHICGGGIGGPWPWFVTRGRALEQLEVLKLSGTDVALKLYCLKYLTNLKELRLRACKSISADEFGWIALPKLEVLDLAETSLDMRGVEAIAGQCRLLHYFDARGCPALSLHRHSEEVRRFSYVGLNTVKMRKKRRPKMPKASYIVEVDEQQADEGEEDVDEGDADEQQAEAGPALEEGDDDDSEDGDNHDEVDDQELDD